MNDVAITCPGAGRLRIQSRTLFGDLKGSTTNAFLACVLDADPRAQVSVILGTTADAPHVAEIRHSGTSAVAFLRAVSSRLRKINGVEAAPLARSRENAKQSLNLSAGIDGNFGSPGPTTAALIAPRTASGTRGSDGNGNGNGAHGHNARNRLPARREPDFEALLPTIEPTVSTPPSRSASRASQLAQIQHQPWQMLQEVPGRMKLKHPFLYRRKSVCQAIERELMSVLGIDSYHMHPGRGTLVLKYNTRALRRDQVLTIIERALAKTEIPPELDPLDLDFPLAVTSVPLAALTQFMFPVLLPVAGALYLFTSITTFKSAFHVAVHEWRLGVDILDAIVVTGCVITGQIFAGSVLGLCLSFGRMLVAKTQDDSKRLLIQAFGKQSQFVKLWKDGHEVEISLEDLHPGDVIVVHTGESVPVDGLVKEGLAMVDQHALTGESTPTEKAAGDRVFASTLTVAGKVFVEVEKAGTDTASAKIAQILKDSAGYKLGSQYKGEKMADRAVVPTLALSALGLATLGPQGAVAVLNRDFGTGIRMAAPLAMLTSLALCASKGILVKDGRALELMHDIDTVLFDKTSTLIPQRPEVVEIIKGLRARGIKHIAIISGDHEGPTRKLAESLQMDEYFAGVLPGDKADYVERLQKQGRKVCFVGDGINDSIALKKANVSISLRGASSIATDTAQIVFMEASLHRLCELRDIASDLDRNVRRSWYMILAPNAFCILGAFTMGFGIMASVLTNNVAALGALANGMLPLYRMLNEQAKKEAQLELTRAMSQFLGAGADPVSAPAAIGV